MIESAASPTSTTAHPVKRAPPRPGIATAQQRSAARRIVIAHGRSSLDPLKLWPDKTVEVLHGGSSVVGYRDLLGVRLSLGDVVGPANCAWAATESFLSSAAARGLSPAIVAALPQRLPFYRAFGLRPIALGAEAVVDLERFARHTIHRYEIRRYEHRFGDGAHGFAWLPPPHPAGLVDELAEVSAAWLTIPGRRERGFALGAFARASVAATPVCTLRDPDGRLLAFLSVFSSGLAGAAAVDLMRRRADAPGGAMDYLLRRTLLAARDSGLRHVSLGIAPLKGVGAAAESSRLEWALGLLSRRANWYFSFRGLHRFKDKFQPAWQPRYLVCRTGVIARTRALLALVVAMHGSG